MFISLILLLEVSTLIICEGNIKHIYFDPKTSLTNERRDGVVIVETFDGKRSTICNEDFTNEDAQVICRMMGYSNGLNAFALISSKSSNKDSRIFFSNFSCKGDEATVELCPTFEVKLAKDSCQSHAEDVHLYCNSPRIFSKKFSSTKGKSCDNSVAELRHGNSKMGLLILKSGNKSFTLCGINNNFGENEAKLFCKMLCFKDVKVARIISNYEVKGASIGGFRRMKCSADVSAISECSNVYSDDSELCTPADNIGLACESQPPPKEPKPNIVCNNNLMTLEWNKIVFPGIDPKNVNILNGNLNCTDTVKNFENGLVSLSVKLDQCNPKTIANKEDILFRYNVQIVFPKINRIVVRNTQNFEATCFIARKGIVDDRNINLQSTNMNPVGNKINFKTKLELSTTFDFSKILMQPYSIKIGTTIFGRIILLESPLQIQLVLQKCFLYNTEKDIELIIDERCAVRSDVKINPINDTVIKFNYKSFAMRNENSALFMKCETSKCSKYEIGCSSSCQKF